MTAHTRAKRLKRPRRAVEIGVMAQVPQLAALLLPVPPAAIDEGGTEAGWEVVALGHHTLGVAPPQSPRAVFSGHAEARLGGHVNQADVDRPEEVGDGDQAAHLVRVRARVRDGLGLGLGLLTLALANDQGAHQPSRLISASNELGDSVELELVSGELRADIVPCLEHRPGIQIQIQMH